MLKIDSSKVSLVFFYLVDFLDIKAIRVRPFVFTINGVISARDGKICISFF